MEASKTIIKGAIDGMTENQYLLGEKYFYGSGETRNVALAESWYKEAAKRGHVSATYMLGYILLTGAAGKTDMRKGTSLVKKAAAKNHVKAVLLLAKNYYYGYGIRRNEKYAFRNWKKGAALGSPEADYYLGLCYGKGICVRQDFIKAKKHLYNALENGFDTAKEAINDLERYYEKIAG